MDRYGIMGNPIQHSWSPRVHQLFAKQTQQQLIYEPILVSLDGFRQALDGFQARGGKGLNITSPFKQQAYQLVNALSERATLAKAVNTIQFNPDGSRFGDNTDGVGFIRDVMSGHHFPISGKRVLVLGAGGAVRGILNHVLQEQPEWVVIANRTEEKANVLVSEFSYYSSIQARSLSNLTGFKFDLIINGTSAGLTGDIIDLPKRILSEQAYCYDMTYGKRLTPFMMWAIANHAAMISNGLGMLIEQAAESFYLWRGVKPETQPVLSALTNVNS